MNWDTRIFAVAGIVGGVLLSAVALADAGVAAVTGQYCDPEVRCWMPLVLVDGAHFLSYALMAPVALAIRARYQGQLGRVGRGAAVAFPAVLALLAAGFGIMTVTGSRGGPFESLGSVLFLAMFVVPLVLGISLWRRTRATRAGTLLLIAPFPLALPLVIALHQIGWVPGHPAALEAALYLGVAAFGLERLTAHEDVPSGVTPAVG